MSNQLLAATVGTGIAVVALYPVWGLVYRVIAVTIWEVCITVKNKLKGGGA